MIVFQIRVCRHSVFHAPTSGSITENAEQSLKRAYTTIGLYKGNIVAIKYLHKRSVDLTREIQKELKQVEKQIIQNSNGIKSNIILIQLFLYV